MKNCRLRAVFMRGGTSKAVMFRRDDLPADPRNWEPIFRQVMGSPDPNGRQLDGMGGGISSLSKVCVIGSPSRRWTFTSSAERQPRRFAMIEAALEGQASRAYKRPIDPRYG
jgi:hypothetical protein